jgi:bifunctional DNA-binding transcriptional regulator/antitoxin component of YhaV-PrlF toxin-antitoxin module
MSLTPVGDDVAVILPDETLGRLGWKPGDELVVEPVGERGISLRRAASGANEPEPDPLASA